VSGWLLDTSVISELRRQCPSERVRSFIAGQRLEDLFVSTVTFAEKRYSIETVGDPVRRADLSDWLLHRVRPMFDQRVPEVSEDVMFKWRLIVEDGRKVGHTFSRPDLIIAATALRHGLTVVTRDTGDYKLARVPLLNPWVDESS
jgi:predicted nucleic acid-binding protein